MVFGSTKVVMTQPSQRIDKWLWFARFAKTRTLAAGLVSTGRIRVNRSKVSKPSTMIKPGDVITATIGRRIRVIKIVDVGSRRGPAPEAMCLYEDLTPPVDTPISGPGEPRRDSTFGARVPGTGRPTKRDRRLIDRWRGHGR